MTSVNQRAFEIVQRMIADANALGLAVTRLENGATIVDAGINVPGSLEAGRWFAQACLGGLGEVTFCQLPLGDIWPPGVAVSVSQPVAACMAAQYAGWMIKEGEYLAMGSGPARSLYAGEPLFQRLAYRDESDVAVLALETRDMPPIAAVERVAGKCGVSPERLFLLVAPTSCLVGSVQVAARVVETGLHKMHEIGFDIDSLVSGFGTCPLAPLAKSDARAIGRTNDGVLYGGRVWYTAAAGDADITAVIERLPSSASPDYGTPFYDLLKRYKGDFYQIDPMLFSPAAVCINNATSGNTFCAGQVNVELIRESFSL
jgi:methenyltetrahydromethanopterin cyclohydrolase